MQVSHKTILRLSALVWAAIGLMLLRLGIYFSLDGYQESTVYIQLSVIITAIILGQVKSRLVLQKVAMRSYTRISSLPNPTAITAIYTPVNYIVIGSMIALGMSMKYIGLPVIVRGFIDIAVGTALIQGAIFYLHFAKLAKASH